MASRTSARRQGVGERAWGGLLQVYADLVPLLDKRLKAVGLPLAWYDVLLELNAAPDRRLRMGELGERVVLSRSRVSRLVDELCKAGLVIRIVDADDRRAAHAKLTEAGRVRLRSAAPVYLAGIQELFACHLTETELDVLAKVMWRLHAEHSAATSAVSKRSSQVFR